MVNNVPKSIKNKVNKLLVLKYKAKMLEDEINSWVSKQGIDTGELSYIDGISVRLSYAEFANADEFESELIKYSKGEDVGYG